MKFIRILISSTIVHGALALSISLGVWSIIGQYQLVSVWTTVPLCFYNQESFAIQAPEYVHVQLYGKRNQFAYCDVSQLALHIDADFLTEGKQLFIPTARNLLVGEGISVLNYSPSNLIITRKTCKT